LERGRALSHHVEARPNGFSIGRAINININEQTTNGGQYRGLPLAESDITRVKESGLDTVRIMTDGGYFMGPSGEILHLDALDAAINNVVNARLKAVVDIHATSPGFNQSILCGDKLPIFNVFLRNLAAHLQRTYQMSEVALELINEPSDDSNCNLAASYGQKLKSMYFAARSGSPNITVVLSPLAKSNIFQLNDLDGFVSTITDVNTIFTVHYYGPLEFSHQGAFYIPGQQYLNYFGGMPYPSSRIDVPARGALWNRIQAIGDARGQSAWMAAGKIVFDAYFGYNGGAGYGRGDIDYIVRNNVVTWADSHGIERSRIWLGEFGVQGSQRDTRAIPEDQNWRVNPIEGANPIDRAEWTRDVRQIFETYGMPWSYFQLGNGAYSALQDRDFPTTNFSAWDQTITDALGLSNPR
jgi:Cellulase (glycosyl hydrolase family 5)